MKKKIVIAVLIFLHNSRIYAEKFDIIENYKSTAHTLKANHKAHIPFLLEVNIPLCGSQINLGEFNIQFSLLLASQPIRSEKAAF